MPVDKMGGGKGTGCNAIVWKLQAPIFRPQISVGSRAMRTGAKCLNISTCNRDKKSPRVL